jgi:hypothetical protein
MYRIFTCTHFEQRFCQTTAVRVRRTKTPTLCPVNFFRRSQVFSDTEENNNPLEIVCYTHVSELVSLRNDAQNKGSEGIFGTSLPSTPICSVHYATALPGHTQPDT